MSTHTSPPVKHTTTNATPTNPFIDTSVAAINSNPVELDSTPVSPVTKKSESWKPSHIVSPDEEEEEAYEQLFPGEKGGSEVVREKRKQLLAERSKDPAVLVDIPPTPRAEEYEIAEETLNEGTPEAVAAARLKRDEKEMDNDEPR